jgi:hypothetical protein
MNIKQLYNNNNYKHYSDGSKKRKIIHIGKMPGYNSIIDPHKTSIELKMAGLNVVDIIPVHYILNPKYLSGSSKSEIPKKVTSSEEEENDNKGLVDSVTETVTSVDYENIGKNIVNGIENEKLLVKSSDIGKDTSGADKRFGEALKGLVKNYKNETNKPFSRYMQDKITEKGDNYIIRMFATTESSFTESLSSSSTESPILSFLKNSFTNNNTVETMKGLGRLLNDMLIMANYDPTSDKTDKVKSALEGIGLENKAMLNGISNLTNGALISIMGGTVPLPNIWSNSSAQTIANIKITLTSPDGHPDNIQKFVIDPLITMIVASSGLNHFGSLVSQPVFWEVRAYGSMHIKAAIIRNISISRNTNVKTNMFSQPLSVDLNVIFEPLLESFAVSTNTSDFVGMGVKEVLKSLNPVDTTLGMFCNN